LDEVLVAAVLSTFTAARAQLEAWAASGAAAGAEPLSEAAALRGGGAAKTWGASEDEGEEDASGDDEGAEEDGEEWGGDGDGERWDAEEAGGGEDQFWAADEDGDGRGEGGGGGAGAMPPPHPPHAPTLAAVLAMDQLAVLRALERAARRLASAAQRRGPPPGLAEGAWLYALLCALHTPLLGTSSALLRELFLVLRDRRAGALAAGSAAAGSALVAADTVACVVLGRFFGVRLASEGM
jgi:hypothetical protein